MRPDFIKRCAILEDKDTPHFCGSACLLSLCVIIEDIEKTSIGFHKVFPELNDLILKLFDDDSKLFDLSKITDELTLAQWNEAISVLDDYTELLEKLTDLEDFCIGSKKYRYLPFVTLDKNFLIGIAASSAEAFQARNDQPESFKRCYNSLLIASRKDNHLSCCADLKDSLSISHDVLLETALPALAMLVKLVCRKNNGKKPFSAEFDFKSSHDFIKETQNSFFRQLKNKEIMDDNAESLNTLSSIALKAREEIKLASLKEDYSWISSIFQDCKKAFML